MPATDYLPRPRYNIVVGIFPGTASAAKFAMYQIVIRTSNISLISTHIAILTLAQYIVYTAL
ncbi:hypothetical protein F4825DRAFT_411361 [Nemania diffusa]|nr:hypothetical protein F4825DRAFT_411361 [Nemania diffusa]